MLSVLGNIIQWCSQGAFANGSVALPCQQPLLWERYELCLKSPENNTGVSETGVHHTPPPQNKWGNLWYSRIFLFSDPQMELAVQVPSGTGWPRQIIHSWERIRRKTWTSQASLRRVFIDLKFTSLAPQDSTRLSRFVSSFSMMCQHDHPRAAENTHPKMKLSIELSTHPNSGWKDTILRSWLCPNWWIYVNLEYQHHITSPSCWGLTWLCLKKMCPECPESTGRIIILLEYMEVS
jgi:hypothetical protein